MLYAKKANKYLKIDEKSSASYIKLGYDIVKIENDIEVIVSEGEGKSVPAKSLAEAVAENKKLKEELEKATKAKAKDEAKAETEKKANKE